MIKRLYGLYFFLIVLQLSGCNPARESLKVHELPNYNHSVADHILFLDFKIAASGLSSPEKVKLVNSISGNGRMKAQTFHVVAPYQIKILQRYRNGRQAVETSYTHPLFRSVEVPDPAAPLVRTELNVPEGILSVRVQEDIDMESIDLYSIKPGKPPLKIYTLRLKK